METHLNSQFIPFEHARMMKECGFDEECFAHYQGQVEEHIYLRIDATRKQNQYLGQLYSAPLFQQAEEWLWEKYNTPILIKKEYPQLPVEGRPYYQNTFSGLTFSSPILARREGILKAIEYINKNHKAK